MAVAAGLSVRTIGRALAGHAVRRGTLLELADVLRVPPSWLLEGKGTFNRAWVTPPQLGPLPGGGGIAQGAPVPLPRAAAQDQAPLSRTRIDARILARVLDLVDLIAKDEPNEVKARRIARAYDEATLPADELPPLPPHPHSESFE
ncbi:MAG: hypothetical protein KGK10_06965 [Rhodospirillales bacterium]|nr:hypothetical protein [Rhodospirillales bacterium]